MKRNMQMFPQDRKEYEEELQQEKELPKLIKEELEYCFINSIKVFKAKYKFPKTNENNAISDLLFELYEKFGEKFIVAIDDVATLFKFVIDSKTKEVTNVFIKSANDARLRKIYFFKNKLLDGVATLYQDKYPYLPYKMQTYINGKLLEETYLK